MIDPVQTSFQTLNTLEEKLIDAKAKKLPFRSFMEILLESSIFVPSFTEVQHDGSGISPVVFDREGISMIAIYTDISRTRDIEASPEYCLKIETKDFISRLPQGCGLVLNPGYTEGLEISPNGIENILQKF